MTQLHLFLVKSNTYKKLNLFDLAAIRIKNSDVKAQVNEGDLIEIISPFVNSENFIGMITKVDEKTMTVYHADIRKEIMWNRFVNCLIHKV